MRASSCTARRKHEMGIALLIAIFVLLLVCVVGIAMVLASGTESALTGNYHSSTSSYYAALAGLEEARGRLLPANPSYFGSTDPNFMPAAGAPLNIDEVRYIINPLPGETVNPTSADPLDYPDTEYDREFVPNTLADAVANGKVKIANSVFTGAPLPGPPYKWVRINAVTESSININVNGDSTLNNTVPLYYDRANLSAGGTPNPSLILSLTPPSTAVQALEVTSLAVLPNGTQKLLQYVVAADTLPFSFTVPAALTLAGNGVSFTPPPAPNPQYHISGVDQSGGVGVCNPPAPNLPAIGVLNSSDRSAVIGSIGANQPSSYSGSSPTPSVVDVSSLIDPTLQTPQGLEQLVSEIRSNADARITGPANSADLPSSMDSDHPKTIVVDGDFNLNAGKYGYGILVVTGTFRYGDNSGWNGLILVIGQGAVEEYAQSGGGAFNGAVLVAKTRDSSGNLLSVLGPASYRFDSAGNNGVYYHSCKINDAIGGVPGGLGGSGAPLSFKILSFHEIAQ